jgi:hypothetical protein
MNKIKKAMQDIRSEFNKDRNSEKNQILIPEMKIKISKIKTQ